MFDLYNVRPDKIRRAKNLFVGHLSKKQRKQVEKISDVALRVIIREMDKKGYPSYYLDYVPAVIMAHIFLGRGDYDRKKSKHDKEQEALGITAFATAGWELEGILEYHKDNRIYPGENFGHSIHKVDEFCFPGRWKKRYL